MKKASLPFVVALVTVAVYATTASAGVSSYGAYSYTPSYSSYGYTPTYSSPSYDTPTYPSYTSSYHAPTYPSYTSSYDGQLNAAGFPKNQYVSPYVTKSGKYVGGHYRNSPADGLRTCSIVRC